MERSKARKRYTVRVPNSQPKRNHDPITSCSVSRLWHWSVDFLRNNWAEITKFLTVGGINYLVDLAIFNLLLLVVFPEWPLLDKCAAVSVSTIFSWIVNRSWTFRGRGGHCVISEAALFVLVNIIGALPPLLCLGISHYLMGLTSPLADNISANVIGLVLGTALRYVLYRLVVFPERHP